MARIPRSQVIIMDDGKDEKTGQQVRPAWLPGESVAIRTAVGGGYRQAIQDARHIITQGDDGKDVYHPNNRAVALLTYQTYVVDGTIIDEDSGETLKATPELLDSLDAGYQGFILRKIAENQAAWDKLGGGGDPTARKTFQASDAPAAGGQEQGAQAT